MPPETDTPLLVDAHAKLTGTITLELLEPVEKPFRIPATEALDHF